MINLRTFSYFRYSINSIVFASLLINNSIYFLRTIGYIFLILAMILIVAQAVRTKVFKFDFKILYLLIPITIVYFVGMCRNLSNSSVKAFVLLLSTFLLFCMFCQYYEQVILYQNKLLLIVLPMFLVVFYVAYFLKYGVSSVDGGYKGVFSTTTFSGVFFTMLIELCVLNYMIDKRKCWFIYSFLFAFLVYKTKVRTAYIGIVFIFVYYWIINISKNKINVGKIIKIIRVLTYVTILSFIMIYPVIDKYRFYSTLSDFVYQYTGKILLSGRNIIWQYYIQRIREKPFFGYGLDFAYNFTDSVSSVHNSYLNMLLQVGFVGLICVFLLINYVLVRLEKSNNKGSHTIEVFTLINLVMCTTEVMLLQGQVVLQIIIWVLMGVGLGLARKEKIE